MTANTPRITVVVPSLNQGAFLEDAIRSVLTQDYPHAELIVMDGGSLDGSVAILQRYHSQIAYWQSAADDGPAAALADGFRHASGEIFVVLNADDFFLPGTFSTIAEAFTVQPEIDVISGHGYFASRDGALGAPTYSDPWSLRRFQYGACVLVQPSTFFRKSIYERAGGFRAQRSVCWDMELWADMASAGARFMRLDAFLSAFRIHDDSITGRPELVHLRRTHARAVMTRMRGRPERIVDRLLHYYLRGVKFLDHPRHTLHQRLYIYSLLKRWSL